MKKITFLMAFLALLNWQANAQILNQPAGWPDTNWTVGGTYTATGLVNNPRLTANFTFDDYAAGSGSIDTIFAESPVIDLAAAKAGGETWIFINGDFVYRALGGDLLTIDYWDADATSWVTIKTFVGNTTTTADYQGCLNMVAYTTTELNIAGFTPAQLSGFKYRISYNDNVGWQWGWCVGSPTIVSSTPPSCIDPSVLTATAITATTANLGWTENGTATTWNVEWGFQWFTLGTGITLSTITNPYNLTGLTPNTSYQFYVQSNCGTDSSAWSGPYTFTTLCSTAALTYNQDFTTWPLVCWDLTGGTQSWDDNGGGIARANFWSWVVPNNAIMTSEPINISVDARVKFKWSHLYNATYPGDSLSVDVKILPAGVWTSIWAKGAANLNSLDGAGNSTPGTMVAETVNLLPATYTGQNIQVRFYANSGYGPDLFVDNLVVEALQSCSMPSNLTLLAYVQPNGALIGWTENGTATEWQVQWGVTGFALGTGTIDTTTSNPYTVQPLMSQTAYDFYVRSTCGVGDTSAWVGPLTFMIPCLPIGLELGADTTLCSNQTLTLNAPTGGSYGYSWSTGDSTPSIVVDTTSLGGNGTYYISVNVMDFATGCDYIDTIRVTFSVCVGLNEKAGLPGFTIYPNPTNGLFTVNTPAAERATIEVVNLQGKVIYKNNLTSSNQLIDLSANAKGVYFVTVTTTNGVEIQKMVIQ